MKVIILKYFSCILWQHIDEKTSLHYFQPRFKITNTSIDFWTYTVFCTLSVDDGFSVSIFSLARYVFQEDIYCYFVTVQLNIECNLYCDYNHENF